MKERGILFSGPMVRAVLEDRKTQTRRVITPQPPPADRVKAICGSDYSLFTDENEPNVWRVAGPVWAVRDIMKKEDSKLRWKCPYGVPGNQLYVRETFYCDDYSYPDVPLRMIQDEDWRGRMLYYSADGDVSKQIPECEGTPKLIPGIHMPRWASRITLEIVSVKVERVQDISDLDAYAEGVSPCGHDAHRTTQWTCVFHTLWDSINNERGYGWDKNPFCWVLTFCRVRTTPKEVRCQ